MKRSNNIQIEVEKTLSSLDNWKKNEAKPYFYERFKAKLENQIQNSWFGYVIELPFIKPAFFIFIILLNIYTLINVYELKNIQQTEYSAVVDTLNDEYALNLSTETVLNLNNE